MRYQRSILKLYYNITCHYLEEYLPCIPKLILTNAKKYYGKIVFVNDIPTQIALSKHNLDMYIEWLEQDDIIEIIDTICHELAHITCRGHNADHQELTKAYKDYVLSMLELNKINKSLSA